MDEKKVKEAIKEFEIEKQTYEDMISYCKHFEPKNDCERYEEKIAICKTAIEALEKQLPKKPNFEGDGYAPNGTFVYDTWICPSCEGYYEVDYDDYVYCPQCGQKLDWSEN